MLNLEAQPCQPRAYQDLHLPITDHINVIQQYSTVKHDIACHSFVHSIAFTLTNGRFSIDPIHMHYVGHILVTSRNAYLAMPKACPLALRDLFQSANNASDKFPLINSQ
jgi:hypothetical protein